MAFWSEWFRRAPSAPPAIPGRREVGMTATGRPTYSTLLGGYSTLPRPQSLRLLGQFHAAIPTLPRAIYVLTDLVGCPCLVGESEAETKQLNAWATGLKYGGMAGGMSRWLADHLAQMLLYGYAVGEMTAAPDRSGIDTLWAYKSPPFGFRTDKAGQITIVQESVLDGERTLNPDSALHTAYRPEGCDPNGRSLFFASHTFCQAWLDIAHAFRATWKRNGIPIYHVHTQLPETLNDPDGSTGSAVASALGSNWAETMRSQVMDGRAKDFCTANVGDTSVRVIGADGSIIDIAVSKRAIVEEIVVASGIPGWLLGYIWSSTERLSSVQAGLLTTSVQGIRRAVEPCIRRVVGTHLRLSGRRGAEYEIEWSDVSMVDLEATARAASLDAAAQLSRQKYYRQLWADGVISQERYAQEMTGMAQVEVEMEAPTMAPSRGAGTETGTAA